MKSTLVYFLSIIGVWCCQTSINIADQGFLDFEVQTNKLYYCKAQGDISTMFMIYSMLLTCIAVFLILSFVFPFM